MYTVYWKDYKIDGKFYRDPFSEKEVKISNRIWKSYLKDNYNLIPQEVYNIVNGFDVDYRGLCKICGHPETNWSIQRGYSPVCMNPECRGKSTGLRTSEMNRNNWKKPEYREWRSKICSEVTTKFLKEKWKDPDYRKLKSEQHSERMSRFNSDKVFHSKARKGFFMKLGSPLDRCYFYIGLTKDKVKYGVTSRYHKRTIEVGISNPHKLLESTREYVADLEEYINSEFGSEYIERSQISEFFKLFRDGVQRLGDPPYPDNISGETPHPDN